MARRSAGVRLLRDDVVIHEGTLKTLKRFKDEVPEVQSGQECGMAFEKYEDIREGDVIEIFERDRGRAQAGLSRGRKRELKGRPGRIIGRAFSCRHRGTSGVCLAQAR